MSFDYQLTESVRRKLLESIQFETILVRQKLIDLKRTCCVLLSITPVVWFSETTISTNFKTVTFKKDFKLT